VATRGRVAVTFGAGRPMEMREYDVRPPQPGEALVRLSRASICGSDLHIWRGEVAGLTGLPGVGGHEMTGVVAALGSERHRDSTGKALAEGDRVTFAYFTPCGECAACLTGITGCPNRYRRRKALTVDDDPHFIGAYGDYYYVQPDQWVYRVPDGLPDALVAPVNCALSQVVYGLQRVGIWLGDSVVIQGAGGLGLYAIAVARDMGAGTIIVLDAVPARLDLARRFGADHLLNVRDMPRRADRVEQVRAWTGEGADVCVEVAGVAAVMQEGIEFLRVGGRYLTMGNIVAGATAEIVPHDMVRTPKSVLGVLSYDRWVIPRALDWLARRLAAYPFAALVADTFPLERIDAAFATADWASGQGEVGRALIALDGR
jgi:L-iditol 2-dehydrogenase